MLPLPRSLLKRVRLTVSRALDLTSRSPPPPVAFCSDESGLRIHATDGETTIEYFDSDLSGDEEFCFSLDDLKACEGSRGDPLTFTESGDKIVASWSESGVARSTSFDASQRLEHVGERPELVACDTQLLDALKIAAETTDRENARYSLGHIRLTADGQVQATDSRQLFVESGFDFPWDDDLLIPGGRVFGSPEFRSGNECAVGTTEDHVALRADRWTLWLPIGKGLRFPNVEGMLEQTAPASTIRLGERDAEFLRTSAKSFPGAKNQNSPLTIEANGVVTLRAGEAGDDEGTQVTLSESHLEGDAVAVVMNRKYLIRAADLGFQEIAVTEPSQPLVCEDGARRYLWAPLDPPKAPVSAAPARSEHSPTPSTHSDIHSGTEVMTEPDPDPTPLESAEALRDSLRESLSRTRELISALKREAKQNKLVESTLASLRKLSDAA